MSLRVFCFEGTFLNEWEVEKIKELMFKGDFPLQSVALKSGKSFFWTEEGCVPFEKSKFALVMAGEPLAPSHLKNIVFQKFKDYGHSLKLPVCAYYVSGSFSPPGFRKMKVGQSSIVHLREFSLKGEKNKEIRRALNHGRRADLEFRELSGAEGRKVEEELFKLHRYWLKTRRGPQIHFLLSRPDLRSGGRYFFVFEKGEISAFVSLYRYDHGYYLDDMIQSPKGHRFALDFLIAQVLLLLEKEGVSELSLGFNAFEGVGTHGFSLVLRFLEQAQWPYKSQGLRAFKRKFNGKEVSRYILTEEKTSICKQLLAMISVTYLPAKERDDLFAPDLAPTLPKSIF